jgi:hypothetical protein
MAVIEKEIRLLGSKEAVRLTFYIDSSRFTDEFIEREREK